MSAFVEAKLVNDPFENIAVAVRFRFGRRMMFFDLGDLRRLTPRALQSVDLAFVSHRHMDHFAGFDRLVEHLLYRQGRLHLAGPPGFVGGVEAKLAGYTWNLLGPTSPDFRITASDHGDKGEIRHAEFRAREGFVMRPLPRRLPAGIAHEDPEFRVEYEVLDHGTPVLAYALQERQSIHVDPVALAAADLTPGPWLSAAKALLRAGTDPATVVDAGTRQVRLGDLSGSVLTIGPGQRVAFVTDCAFTASNAERILALAKGADHLFIEAGFLHADVAIAGARRHLTARQAGWLAREAGVVRATPVHFSGRYETREAELRAEFRAARSGRLAPPPLVPGDRPMMR